ncbi:MAG TPA: integrase arm-type DNA-binding domain-containing protein [Hyphomicrobiaceae bacterium]
MPLSVRKVETAPAGRYTDGRGLMLLVKPSGARSWVLRYQLDGRRRDMGLGPYPEVTLAAAREKTLAARRQLVEGIDPLNVPTTRLTTFRDAAADLITSKSPGWRSAKHAAQWTSTLSTYAFPTLGCVDVKAIDTPKVLSVLRPVWTSKPETASRLRQRIEAVLDYAAAQGLRGGPNPARWRGHLQNLLPRPSSVRRVQHHPALDWRDMPAFMADLGQRNGTSARALEFVVATAARSGEVRGTRWGEIDLRSCVWTLPAGRMKASKEHRVPLTARAIEVLGEPGPIPSLVFPAHSDPDRPLSDMALTALLKRMGRADITVHGFRSTFRDWAGETTSFPREVIEAALAHRLKDKAEAAYARGDLFEKRRKLMDAWSAFILATAQPR